MRTSTQGIRFRLMLLGVLPACFIGLALTSYFIHTQMASSYQALSNRGVLIVRQLAVSSSAPIASGNLHLLQELANSTINEIDVVEITIADAQGNVLAMQKRQSNGLKNPLVLTAAIYPQHLNNIASDTQPNTAKPDEKNGYISLVLSRQRTAKQQENMIWITLSLFAAGLISAIWVARSMIKVISNPVMALTFAVHELSNGNMDARAEAEAVTELAYLQAGFNAMAAELKKNRESLERQVQQSTLRLRETLAALERRNLELEAARGYAEVQTKLKSQFLAQMSHEIRTPMNGIIGFAELLEKTPLNADQSEKLGMISRSSRNLLAISNEILDLSKLEAGKISLDNKIFSLRPILEDVIALLCVPFKRASVILWVDPEVPCMIESDPVRIQQIIANFLSNALKFAQSGRIVIRVRTLMRKEGERLLVFVSDSGSGISHTDFAKLFSPFQQLEASTLLSTEKGSGLGLSIAKNIVESMGGEIHLASRLGKGTTIWFDLPLNPIPADDLRSQSVFLRGETPCRLRDAVLPLKSEMIRLIGLVEPDRLLGQALRQQLEGIGASVVMYDTLEESSRQLDGTARPSHIVYFHRKKAKFGGMSLPRWLEWCDNQKIKPILLFSANARRLVNFFQQRKINCLFHPTASVRLAKTLDLVDLGAMAQPLPFTELPVAIHPLNAGKRLRFLVADDNEINRLLLRAHLERIGAEVAEAQDGKVALERIRQRRFDLLFLDLQMPRMDGLQVLKKMREKSGPCQNVPVVAITAFCVPEQKESLIKEGFTGCLLKPVTEEQVLTLIGELLPSTEQGFTEVPPAYEYAHAILRHTDGNRHLADMIAGKLFLELPECLENAQKALDTEAREAARQAVHKINGSAGFSGLPAIQASAASLESALINALDFGKLNLLCDELKQEIERFLSLQQEILNILEDEE